MKNTFVCATSYGNANNEKVLLNLPPNQLRSKTNLKRTKYAIFKGLSLKYANPYK